MFAQTQLESFRPPFSKGGEVKGEKPLRPPQRAKHPFPYLNAGEGEFLCLAKKEGEPSSGVLPLFLFRVYTWGKETFFKKVSSPHNNDNNNNKNKN